MRIGRYKIKIDFDTQEALYWWPWVAKLFWVPDWKVVRVRWFHRNMDIEAIKDRRSEGKKEGGRSF